MVALEKRLCYHLFVKEKMMPDYILLDDVIDDMLDNISYIKLNTYLNVDEED